MGKQKKKTYLWWRLLCLAAIANIGIWLWALVTVADTQGFPKIQLALSGIYVFVCAFRSFYPRIDLERYCLIDSPWSSIILGRSLATLAEISFSIQIALCVYFLGIHISADWIIFIAYVIVPIIVLAQICCWHAMLTLNHFWHAIEEFLWVIMLALAAACCISGYFVLDGIPQLLMLVGLVSSIGAAAIMLFVDIPMYFRRTQQQTRLGVKYLGIAEGIKDAANRRNKKRKWRIWKTEVVWISSYFTIGVWLSIAMIFVKF